MRSETWKEIISTESVCPVAAIVSAIWTGSAAGAAKQLDPEIIIVLGSQLNEITDKTKTRKGKYCV